MRAGLGYYLEGRIGWCNDTDIAFASAARAAEARAKRRGLVTDQGSVKVAFFEDGCRAQFDAVPVLASCSVDSVKPGTSETRGESVDTYYTVDFMQGASAMKACLQKNGTWADGTALAGVEVLRKLACNKNVAGFFKLVDRERVVGSLAMRLRTSKSVASKGWDGAIDEWSKDIDRGDKGFICAWEVTKLATATTVMVKLVSGRSAQLEFEKRGDSWAMVAYESS